MEFIKERPEDVLQIFRCFEKADPKLREARIIAKPSLLTLHDQPAWILPICLKQPLHYQSDFYMLYYPYGGQVVFYKRCGNLSPSATIAGKSCAYEKNRIFNMYSRIYEMNSDENGQYLKISYKSALLTEQDFKKDFQSEYFFDRKWFLKSVKLVEVQDCILRWIAEMETLEGTNFQISIDPLGHSYASTLDQTSAAVDGKQVQENKDYFSINNLTDAVFIPQFVTLRYRAGKLEIQNFSKAQKMPPLEAFGGIFYREDALFDFCY